MFATIQNGQIANKAYVLQTKKKVCETFLNLLWDEGLILGYKKINGNPDFLKIYLKYKKGKPVISNFKVLSKPGKRVYYPASYICKLKASKTFLVLSTNFGLKTITDCKQLQVGGEPFVEIF